MTRKTTLELSADEIKKAIADSLKIKGYSAKENDVILKIDFRNGDYLLNPIIIVQEQRSQ